MQKIEQELSRFFPDDGIKDLLQAYKNILTNYVSLNWQGVLKEGGIFVEDVFRLLVFLSEQKLPIEIKSVDRTRRKLESDTNLSETARLLIPRVAWGMVYTPRSKKHAVHRKMLAPEYMDVHLCVHAASWILAEMLREYCDSHSSEIGDLVREIMKEHMPYLEVIEGETFVTAEVDCKTEILIHLNDAEPNGLTRRQVGQRIKRPSYTVTKSLSSLTESKYICYTTSARYHISGLGRNRLQVGISGLLSKAN